MPRTGERSRKPWFFQRSAQLGIAIVTARVGRESRRSGANVKIEPKTLSNQRATTIKTAKVLGKLPRPYGTNAFWLLRNTWGQSRPV
jgi:hypothetical protein